MRGWLLRWAFLRRFLSLLVFKDDPGGVVHLRHAWVQQLELDCGVVMNVFCNLVEGHQVAEKVSIGADIPEVLKLVVEEPFSEVFFFHGVILALM